MQAFLFCLKKKPQFKINSYKIHLYVFYLQAGEQLTLQKFFVSPQWLPVSFIIDFKTLLLVCKSLNSSVPEDVWCAFKIQYVPPRSLRSSDCLLAVPGAHTLIHGNAASAITAPAFETSNNCRGPGDVRECILKFLHVVLLTAFNPKLLFCFVFLFNCMKMT